MPTPRHSGQHTAQERIAADLRAAIADGRYRPGDQLPGEHALAEQYGVARLTLRRAVALLLEQRVLARVPRRGTFVAHPTTATWDLDTLVPHGGTLDTAVGVATTAADTPAGAAAIGDRLGLAAGELAVCRTRTARASNGAPLGIRAVYVPYALAGDTPLMTPEPLDESEALASATGTRPADGPVAELHVRAPSAAETALLDLPPDTPVLEAVRAVVFTPGARRLLVIRAVLRTGPGIDFLYGGA